MSVSSSKHHCRGLWAPLHLLLEQLVRCTALRGYSAAVAFHVSNSNRRSSGGKISNCRTGICGAVSSASSQTLQRLLHIAVDPLGRDRGHHLGGQPERLAEVFNRQGDGIVGALFPAKQDEPCSGSSAGPCASSRVADGGLLWR